jgi:hypothetical protein
MRTIFKFTLYGLLAIFGIAVVLAVVVIVLNFRDERLDPDVARLLEYSPPQIAAEENGYFAWIGVVGPESETPHAWGRRWHEEARAADAELARGKESVEPAMDRERRTTSLEAKDIPCNDITACLDAVAAEPSSARAILAKARATLDRADQAIAFPAYREAWRPDSSFKSTVAHHPPLWNQLSATRFSLSIAEGRHDEALDRLAREVAFHTRQLQGAETLIAKVVAISYLRNDYQLLNQYLARYPAEAAQRASRLEALLAPLPAGAAEMENVMRMECREGVRLFLNLNTEHIARQREKWKESVLPTDMADAVADFMAAPGYLRNATANEFYRNWQTIFAFDGKSGDEYRQAIEAFQKEQEAKTGTVWRRLRPTNPLGRIMLDIGLPDVRSYYLKRDDLIVLRAGAALQLDLLRRGVDEEAIGRAVREADLIHPYTGETPVWNRTKRTLNYQAQPGRRDQPLVLAL